MRFFAAGLHGIALFLTLNVQFLESPLAGAWLLFHIAGCACLLSSNEPHAPKNFLWWATFGWLCVLALCTFVIRPVPNGALTMWFLAAAPMLALCMKKSFIKSYAVTFLTLLLIYAVGLILQWILNVHYSAMDYSGMLGHTAMSWPLIDPNNAAAVMNTGLLPCFYLALRKKGWIFAAGIFALALFTTGSKAGMLTGIFSCSFMLLLWLKLKIRWIIALATGGAIVAACLPVHIWQPLVSSFNYRVPLWAGAFRLLHINPMTGTGMGTFYYYYKLVKTESVSAGMYAHNDILQFAIEMGIPAAMCFALFVVAIARRLPAIGAFVFLAIFAQSMVEFQFYLPCISLLLGVALAHLLWSEPLCPPDLQ